MYNRMRLLNKVGQLLNLSTIVILVLLFNKPFVHASDVLGDINNNGVVNLEESIYALQVVAGMNPATILDPSSGPRRSAWGTYIYTPGTLSMDVGFSNFDNAGITTGEYEFPISEVTETTFTVGPRIFVRSPGTAGDIVGKWDFSDGDGNIETLIFDNAGAMLYTAEGPMFTEVLEVQTSSMTIDGNFGDWSGVTELDLHNSESDCEANVGRAITNISVAQDTDSIYVMMILDNLPDNTFRYFVGDDLFKIWVSPSPADCGFQTDIGSEESGTAQFSDNMLECRVDKCLVKNAWNKAGYDIKASHHGDCKSTSNIRLLEFDFSTCP